MEIKFDPNNNKEYLKLNKTVDGYMKKFYKFLKSFLFISLWLIFSSFLNQYWNSFHWEYIYLNSRIIFDKEFWFVVEKILLGFDIGYWLEAVSYTHLTLPTSYPV